ncbi:kinesin-like protein KIN-10B isoform X2 [Ricinus communis]|uniref:kinesin-like protein KIN-10B isoform X2 n=1 Tax=Ricinus communis TaxID=3988 RepID=UPI0007729206|nr:kinesin-like protein KIN-10B isoform X2 [Ricinus communis]|eukprot:XP_015582785.1 kinesin-like protein KIN-10B isoform X2 [Ricinus communis]
MEVETSSLNTPRSIKTCMDTSFISKVRVIVRVRPFLPQEIASKNGTLTSCCISVIDREDCESEEEVTVRLQDPDTSRKECYQLDSFFGQEDNSICKIFEREVRPLIPGIFEGFNATVFAYGATGSGKTYTMQGTDKLPGLMTLAMSTILSMCQSRGSKVDISYYEVYMDRCYDLLELKAKEIEILDDKDKQTHLKGLSKVSANSMAEFQEVFARGTQRRKIAHTGLNDVSSRSHGVLVIRVSTPCCDGSGAVINGKLNLIDLAGNEDNRKTCNEGIRLQESAKINQSLFSLSNVIYALNNNMPRVPYRESKLTRILQDSLGGTSRALMVACLNPGEYQESVHTVSLAARSRHISNFVSPAQKLETPKVKVDMEAKLRAWLESKGKIKSAQRIGAYGSPFPASSIKKSNYQSSVKAKGNSNRDISDAKERTKPVPFRTLFNDASLENLQSVAKDNRKETSADSDETVMQLTTELPVELLDKGQKSTEQASQVSERKTTLESPLRKVISPINSNINCFACEVVPAEQKSSAFFEPKTPITPSTATRTNDQFAAAVTPLNKFNAMSATLKSSLVQVYVGFLNSASREELLEINGIGLKMAEYIVELRETSPLKSLSDLEKLGLSSKQVHNMFSRAARGIFERQEVSTTPSRSNNLSMDTSSINQTTNQALIAE